MTDEEMKASCTDVEKRLRAGLAVTACEAGLADACRQLAAENARLRAALKPFAECGDRLHGYRFTDDRHFGLPPFTAGGTPTVGDCRRAAELLKEVNRV